MSIVFFFIKYAGKILLGVVGIIVSKFLGNATRKMNLYSLISRKFDLFVLGCATTEMLSVFAVKHVK